MLNFCTLFNSVYLSRGLALYESLKANCKDFHLYIFAFDDKTYDFFNQGDFSNLTPISLKDFEDEELLRVKPTRKRGEYCWTCTSSTILYVLEHYKVDHCIYVDADLYFFSNPQVLVDEMKDSSVMLTEHRYTPCYDQTVTSGKYCVQFMLFKNDDRGLRALTWWRERCLEWCYARKEGGKFGDQMYLDDWLERFEGVYVLKHLGGGVAPWNMQQYRFFSENEKLIGEEVDTGKRFPLVFYHFHKVSFLNSRYFSPHFGYGMPYIETFDLIFCPMIHKIKAIRKQYAKVASYEKYFSLKNCILYVLRVIKHKNISNEIHYILKSSVSDYHNDC